ncbi:MAG: C39 family peptidase [Clostridiales bacterium]|nr:C39 family peptidase [Clostridiales bacterium]
MRKGAVEIENTNGKSTAQKIAHGAQLIKGAAKSAGGIASGNFVTAVQGAAEMLPSKVILIAAGVLLFFLLLPIMVISAIPQMLFSWGSVNDTDLIARNRHGSELVAEYHTEIDACPGGVSPDIYRLIAIESVRSRQNIEDITKADIRKSVANSYTVDSSGRVYNKTPDEMMNSLGFSDEEKNWADLMYNTLNDQYLEPEGGFADQSPEYSDAVIGKKGEMQVVYYSQLDSRWANKSYGKTGTIGSSGCGPTSLAIAVSTLTGKSIDPIMVSEWSEKNGYRCEGYGSYHALIPKGAEHYGLNVEKLGRSSAKELEKHLTSGHLVIAIMAKGHFTSNGHFIVIRGITQDGKILVADPASCKRSQKAWDMSIILNEARGTASAGGPFWAVW